MVPVESLLGGVDFVATGLPGSGSPFRRVTRVWHCPIEAGKVDLRIEVFELRDLISRVVETGRVLALEKGLEVTWNQGLGTDGEQAQFVVTPAPGAIALLGLAGLTNRRRRG